MSTFVKIYLILKFINTILSCQNSMKIEMISYKQ